MEEIHGSFGDFSVEMGDLDMMKKTDLHMCWWGATDGGSIEVRPVIYDGSVIFGSANHNIYAVDTETFGLKWKFKTGSKIISSSPVVYMDTVLIGSYDKNVYCVDAGNGSLRWKFKTGGEIASPGAVHDGTFFFTGRDMMMYALDCKTGRLMWKFKTYNANISEPLIHGDTVILHSGDRNLYCLNCSDGRLLWKFTAEEELLSDIVFPVHGDTLYFGSTGGMLYAMDLATQRIKWKMQISSYGMTKPGTMLGSMLIQPTNSGVLYCISAEGSVVWKVTKVEAVAGVTTDSGRIYLSGGENDHFYCLDGDGNELWKFRTQAPNWSPAIVRDGFVYFGSYDCNLYKLDKDTGTLIQKFTVPGGITTYPNWKEYYELTVKIPESELKLERRRYSLTEDSLDKDAGGAYKSKVTYRMSSQYAAKGKYQRDADEEGL